MAAYDALVAVWSTGRPAGVTGANFQPGDTVARKLAAIAAWQVRKPAPDKVILTPSAILNAIVPDDLAVFSQLQTAQLSLLLSGTAVDISQGTTIRTAIRAMFARQPQTLAKLDDLVASHDSPMVEWWRSVGFEGPVGTADVTLAGLS